MRFEQEPNNAKILDNIFRLVHTIKGTCGFLGLPRLEALTHAAEALMGKFRDGSPVTGEAVTLILATIDRIKAILDELERNQAEPAGDDSDLIARARPHVERCAAAQCGRDRPHRRLAGPQTLERPLRPGEATLDELERAFRETPGPEQPRPRRVRRLRIRRRPQRGRADTPRTPPATTTAPTPRSPTSRSACMSIRSNT